MVEKTCGMMKVPANSNGKATSMFGKPSFADDFLFKLLYGVASI
tara:strand:- start:62616 stop:62747 length:132 start_codon:yes stop_codon:yes gene_type:complete